MPKEIISKALDDERIGPPEVYVTLRDMIALQYEANGFSFLPKYAVQSVLSGRHRSKLRGRGLDFDEVRTYIPGDDIRNIDWKVTARTGKTHTKEFTEEKERPVLLVVDQSSSMFFGSEKHFKSVTAAHLAAISCWRVVDVGDRVGGIVFNDTTIDYVSPKRDRRSVQRYFGLIVKQNQELTAHHVDSNGLNPLNNALQRANELITHDYLVIVISDLYTSDETTVKNLIRMRKNNDVIVTHITDPMEMELLVNNIVISDGDYQTQIDNNKKVKEQYNTDSTTRLQIMKDKCKKYNIPFMEVNTLEEPVNQIRSLFVKSKR